MARALCRAAIARSVRWKKEHRVWTARRNAGPALRPLRAEHERRPQPEHPAPQPVVISEAEIDLALQLIQTLTMEFDLSRFHDRYRDALMQLIQAKVEGKELPAVTTVEAKPTQDLMAALKASLAAAKAG